MSENLEETKDFLIQKGFSEELIVEHDDYELRNVSEKFINILNEENEKYIEEKNKCEKEYEEYRNNENYFFQPEILSRRSPLTIIDAPWGSGKTFFIENLIKLSKNKKIDLKEFKNIIIIDAWKYSNSKNIPEEIMAELFLILTKKYIKSDIKYNFLKIASWLFNTTAIPWIKKIGIDLKKINNEKIDIKKYEENLKEIKVKLEKTIIFFDNVERVGKESWEIIKAIFKISQIDNFVFILPMNTKKMKNNQKTDFGEYPIEKFIDIKIFEFKQDYLSFLLNYGFKEKDAKNINKILNKEINGEKLSIREVEQRFRANNILKINNEYEKWKKIINKIWGSTNEFKKNILMPKVKNYYDYLIKLKELHKDFKNIFTKKINQNKYKYSKRTDNINELLKIFLNYEWSSLYNKWITNFNFVIDNLEEYYKNLIKKIIKSEKEITKIDEEIKKIEEEIKLTENKIDELEKEIKKLKNGNDESKINYEKIHNKRKEIENHQKNINHNNSDIVWKNYEKIQIDERILRMSDLIKDWEEDILSLTEIKKNYEKIEKENSFDKQITNSKNELEKTKELDIENKEIFLNNLSNKILEKYILN